MGEPNLQYIQIRLSQKHPKTDICDLHTKQNKYGLGAGVYPKALAPKPPFYPFCRCLTAPRYDLKDERDREHPKSEQAYLRSLPIHEAAQVMGSRAKLQRLLEGEKLDDLLNEGKDALYHLKRMGEFGKTSMIEFERMNIRSFAKDAITIADKKIELVIGLVANHEMIKQATGFDLSGYKRILDNYGVRHTLKSHGDIRKEAKRGQIAVTLEDFELIPVITSEPDSVFPDGKNKIGRDVLVFTKTIDGIGYRYVEEIRSKNKLVATDSLRKKKGDW